MSQAIAFRVSRGHGRMWSGATVVWGGGGQGWRWFRAVGVWGAVFQGLQCIMDRDGGGTGRQWAQAAVVGGDR